MIQGWGWRGCLAFGYDCAYREMGGKGGMNEQKAHYFTIHEIAGIDLDFTPAQIRFGVSAGCVAPSLPG